MGRLLHALGKAGYSQEEVYFHELNQKLIQQTRKGEKPKQSESTTRSATIIEFPQAQMKKAA